jgi:hypothetical protein
VPAAPQSARWPIAEFRGGTATPRLLGNKPVWDAAAEVTIAYAASWTPDMATFINAAMTLTGALAINNPTTPCSAAPARSPDCGGRSSFDLRHQWYFGAGAKPPTR